MAKASYAACPHLGWNRKTENMGTLSGRCTYFDICEALKRRHSPRKVCRSNGAGDEIRNDGNGERRDALFCVLSTTFDL